MSYRLKISFLLIKALEIMILFPFKYIRYICSLVNITLTFWYLMLMRNQFCVRFFLCESWNLNEKTAKGKFFCFGEQIWNSSDLFYCDVGGEG